MLVSITHNLLAFAPLPLSSLPLSNSLCFVSRAGGRDRDDNIDDHIVSAGSSVVVTETFVVNDAGIAVGAGTICDVIQGNNAAGNIHVRFSHPHPPWVVLVSRLYATSTELQVRPLSCY